jgi:hypothetical protein
MLELIVHGGSHPHERGDLNGHGRGTGGSGLEGFDDDRLLSGHNIFLRNYKNLFKIKAYYREC